jgi:hypothetical protein
MRNNIDDAMDGLSGMADKALLKKLMKAKGLLQEAIDATQGAPAEEEIDEGELMSLESEMGE